MQLLQIFWITLASRNRQLDQVKAYACVQTMLHAPEMARHDRHICFWGVQHAADGAHWAAAGTRGMRLMPRPRDSESNMKSHTGLVRLASCMHLRPACEASRLPQSC